jgi:hypothetical protein
MDQSPAFAILLHNFEGEFLGAKGWFFHEQPPHVRFFILLGWLGY